VPGTSSLTLSFFLSSTVGGGSGTVGFTNTVFEEKGISEEGATYPMPVLSFGLFWIDIIRVSFSSVTLSSWSCVSSSFSSSSCTLRSNELFSVCKLFRSLRCYFRPSLKTSGSSGIFLISFLRFSFSGRFLYFFRKLLREPIIFHQSSEIFG